MFRSTLMFVAATAVSAAKAAPEPEGNAIVDYAMGLVNDVIAASMAGGKDALGLLIAAPRFGVDCFTWAVDFVRGMPDLATNVFNGDAATLDSLADFCSTTASIVFVTYTSLAALNLLLSVAASVKDYFSSYLVLPTQVAGQKLPKPLLDVRALIQKNILDKIRSFSVNAWIVPLGKQAGAPTLGNMASSCAAATTTCVILSSVPSVLALMRGGANKAQAEALAYTLGTALGLQYLVKIAA